MTAPRVEFWFDFGSTYSYPSVMRIEALAAAHGVEVAWRPFLLGPVFKALGWANSPFIDQPAKSRYMWRDLERRCARYGLPWRRPSSFPRMTVLPVRVALLGAEEPWIGAFSRRVMQLSFAEDREIQDPPVIAEVLASLGLPADDILARAQTEAHKLRLREQTEAARRKGVFGAPTFFVGDEMFWGDDRLEDALAWARDGRAA